MAQVKGIYKFKDTLTPIAFGSQNVNFVSNAGGTERAYVRIQDAEKFNASGKALAYVSYEELNGLYSEETVYAYRNDTDLQVGWQDEGSKTIDFGKTPQTVSDTFYDWLMTNVVVIPINITQDGTTTLATAGKYCDRNIEVNVGIGIDAILDGSFSGEFHSDKITSLRAGAFKGVVGVTSVSLPNCTTFNMGEQFSGATNLESVYLPNLTTMQNANYIFQQTKIRELNLPNLTMILTNANLCYKMQEVEKINLPKLSGARLGSVAFQNTENLVALILGGNELNTLGGAGAFDNSSIENGTGYVYVPDDLVDTYKTATNWSVHADQIKPMSELEV